MFVAEKNGVCAFRSADLSEWSGGETCIPRRGVRCVQAFMRHGKRVLVYSAGRSLYIAAETACGDYKEFPLPVVRRFVLDAFKGAFSRERFCLFGIRGERIYEYSSANLIKWERKTIAGEGFGYGDSGALSVFGCAKKHFVVYPRGADSFIAEADFDGDTIVADCGLRLGEKGFVSTAVDTGRYLIYGADKGVPKFVSAGLTPTGNSGFALTLSEVK